MKQSWLRLFSSLYIILVSVVLIVISAYAWMVISDSPMAGGAGFNVAGGDAIGLPDKTYSIWDGTPVQDISTIQRDEDGVYIITNASEFDAVMDLIARAPENGESGDVAMRLEADISMADLPWTPVTVNPARASSTITIFGNGKEVACLVAPLFASGAEGSESEFIISDLTISHSTIKSTNENGSGAFIEAVSGVGRVSLTNCHLIDSSVSGQYTGGLVGYTAGKSAIGSDPAITSNITISDSSVEDCSLVGIYTVAGIVGRAGAVAETNLAIQNCVVKNTTLTVTSQTDDRGIGTIVGIANYGETYVIDCDAVDVTENGSMDEIHGLVYGSEDYGATGKLVIVNNGETTVRQNQTGVYNVTNADELEAALARAADTTYNGDVTINIMNNIDMSGKSWTPVLLGTENSTATVTINGNGNSLSGLTAPLLAGGVYTQKGQENLVIKDLTIRDSNVVSTNTRGNGALIECVAGLQSLTIENCHLVNSTLTSNTIDANGINQGSRTGGLVGWTAAGIDPDGNTVQTTVNISKCSVQGSAIEGYGTVGGIIGHAGFNASVIHNITDCTVVNTSLTSTESPYKGVGTILGTANIGEVYISGCTSSGVTETVVAGDEASNVQGLVIGRAVIGDRGKLVINDNGDILEFYQKVITATVITPDGINKAMDYSTGFEGELKITLGGDINLPPF